MKKVLIVIYKFPPSSAVYSLRFYKLMRHIGKYDWEPFILTGKEPIADDRYDGNLLKDLPKNIQIVRIKCVDLKEYTKRLMGFAWFFNSSGSFFSDPPRSILLAISRFFIAKPLIWFSELLSRFIDVFPPDSMIGCIPVLYKTGKMMILKEKIDLVFTYGNPHSIHLTGYLIKKKFHLPWIVGYDDEWSQHPWRRPLFDWQKRLDRWLERKVLSAAENVIASTPSYSELYSKLVPNYMSSKFKAITYSYDENDFRYNTKTHSNSYMNFVYTGSLYGDQTPVFFLRAIKSLIDNGLLTKENFQVTFAGMISHKFQTLFQDESINPIVTHHGVCSYRDSINYIHNADVLILIVSSSRGKGNIPAKTFDYIGSGKPILALIPPNGDTAEVITRTGTGVIVPPEDVKSIKNAIITLFQQWKRNELTISPNWDEIKKHESKQITKRFCDIFDSTLTDRIPVS